MKSKPKSPLDGVNDMQEGNKPAREQHELNSTPSLLLPITSPGWAKSVKRRPRKGEAHSQVVLRLAQLLRNRKQASKSKEPGPTREEFDRLFNYSFGVGRVDAQLIAAFLLQYKDCPDVRKHLDKLVSSSAADGDTDFLRELAKAIDEQRRSPKGRDQIRAQLVARKIQRKPGMTVSALGKILDPTSKDSDERASADQAAQRALRDTQMLVPDKRGFKKGAKRKPREKR
jgi:hypothetical protein